MSKFGFDLHGVIDTYPKFFSELSKIIKNNGHEVYIITGSMDSPDLRKELAHYGMVYEGLLSITDHHLEEGTAVTEIDEKGNYWFEASAWNKTKGQFCLKHSIDLHIDDSEVYGDYFEIPYIFFNAFMGRFEWSYGSLSGAFLMMEPESVYKTIINILKKIELENN